MRPSQFYKLIGLVVVLLVIIGWLIPTAADLVIEYNWWKEIGQVDTWIGMLWYSTAPVSAGALVAAVALYIAHARGLHFAGIRRRDNPLYSRLLPLVLVIIAIVLASATIDY